MRVTWFLALPVFSTALLLAGCGLDALPEDKADYAGFWSGPTISLGIGDDASVSYQQNSAGGSTSVDGKIARFDGDDFVVTVFVDIRFEVSEPPHDEEGVLHMTVNDEDLSQ
ncbi:MAG: hypothetical protein IT383_21645 [Deltaproteobacteria bacterium]|nr:hypothetical protein [Deltaproteobacteria bacterium]